MAKSKTAKNTARASSTAVPMWNRKYFVEGLIFLFTFFLFANSITNNYNLDDELVTINHRLTSKGISAIPDIFSSPYYQDESGYSYEYRPVVLTSFAIENQFFGENPHLSHFFNLLLYALSCVLLYRVLLSLFKEYSFLLSFAASLLFAAHSAHTEVVCSIKNRDEILGLFFSLITFLIVLNAIRTSRTWLLLLTPVVFVLALMSKITIIPFVVIIPLALILFTDAGFIKTLLVTILLLIPTYFLLNMGNGQERVTAILGLLAIVVFLLLLVNFKKALRSTQSIISKALTVFFQDGSSINRNILFDSNDYELKSIFTGILPGGNILAVLPILITAGLTALYLFGMSKGYSLVSSIDLVILVILAWRGEKRIAWWAEAMILFILGYNLNFSHDLKLSGYMAIYTKGVGIYLAYQIFFGKRSLFIPAVISFIIFNYANYRLFDNLDGVYWVFMVVLVNRYVRYALLTLVLVRTINLFTFNFLPNKDDFSVYQISDMIFSVVIILVIEFKRADRILFGAILMLQLILFHLQMVKDDKPLEVQSKISNIYAATNKINPKIISTVQNRPLEYVEECANLTSPKTIRIGTSLEILFYYLIKVVVPYPLSFYYGYKVIEPLKITDTIPMISLIVHLLLLLLACVFIKRERRLSFGIFTYLISIAVFSNYIQLVPGMMADRFLLLPSLGWVIVLTSIIWKIFRLDDAPASREAIFRIPKYAKYTFTGVLILYSVISFSRNMDWKDYLTLFRHDIKYVDRSAQAHNLLAVRLMKTSYEINDPTEQMSMRREALGHFEKSIAIYPDFFNVAYDMGRTYTILNMPDSAISAYKRALVINPEFSDCYSAIGDLLYQQKEIEKAIPYFELLIKKYPNQYIGYDKASLMYFLLKNYNMAVELNKTAAMNMPNQPQPYITLSKIYQNRNMKDSARICLQKALEISPGNAVATTMLQSLGN